MKLCYSATSPYVRKVVVLAQETGLDGRVERVTTAAHPVNRNMDLVRMNPLGKVPALILDDGTALFDSPVICEYLDSQHGGAKMFPAPGPARWTALRRQALADGILDAAILLRYEQVLRAEAQRSADWTKGQTAKVTTALDELEGEADKLGSTVDIGTITIGCALGYLDFRFADMGWRNGRPKLAAWYETFAKRPSMSSTVPKE